MGSLDIAPLRTYVEMLQEMRQRLFSLGALCWNRAPRIELGDGATPAVAFAATKTLEREPRRWK